MDIQGIICFLELAKTLSFTKAAERLFMSQSAVSRKIQALEADLHMSLVERTPKTVSLTTAGRVMAEGLSQMADEYHALYLRAQNMSCGFSGELHIGVMPEFMLDVFPLMLNEFERHHPDIYLSLSNEPMDKLRAKLMDGSLDFVVGGRLDLDLQYVPNIQTIRIGRRRLGIALSSVHPLAGAGHPLSLSDFKDDIFVTLPDDVAPARKNLYIRCANAGFVPKVKTAADLSTILLWVETGRCVCILYQNSSLLGNPRIKFAEMENPVPDCMEDLVPTHAEILWNGSVTHNPCKPVFAQYITQYHWPLE